MLDWLRRLAHRLSWVNDREIGEPLRSLLDSGQFDETAELADVITGYGEPEQYAEMQPFDAAAWEAAATARIERGLSELCGLPLRS
jgi:hypothetical protein